MGKLALTIDVEDWYHIPSVCGSDFSVYKNVSEFMKDWGSNYDYLSEPTYDVLEILNNYDIRATFFVVSDIIDNYPGLVEAIYNEGHEIASHGLDHTCTLEMNTKKPRFSRSEFIERNRVAKNKIERVIGSKVYGYRAPNALFSEWMIEPLSKIGFEYDSSLGRNSLIKKNDVSFGYSSFPFNIGNGFNFFEVPFSYWNVLGFDIPTSGGPYLRFFGASIILQGLKQSLNRGSSVLYFHPIDISNKIFPSIGKGRPFYWAIKGDTVKIRLLHIIKSLIRKDVKFSTVHDMISSSDGGLV
jgi:peptidoglycan-N-acetylglucosamine deacetylase